MNFSDLPFDVKLHIFAACRPLDIIRGLRQTSHDLLGVSMDYSLWKGILQRIYLENRILSLNLEVDRMSLKTLEYAATAPSRFTSILRDGRERLEPRSTRSIYLIDQGIRYNGFLPEHLRRFELIPGGRYLLSEHECPSSDHPQDIFDSARIVLWDLHALTTGSGPFNCIKPIASLKGRCCVGPLHPTSDLKGFLLLTRPAPWVQAPQHGQGQEGFSIYEIYPTEKPIFFRLKANHSSWMPVEDSQRRLAGQALYSITSRRALIVEDYEITVWDFVDHKTISWHSPRSQDHNFVTAVLTDAHAVLCNKLSILIWTVPDLYPSASVSHRSRDKHCLEPCLIINLSENTSSDLPSNITSDRILFLDRWYNGPKPEAPFYIDHFRCNVQGQWSRDKTAKRYDIHFSDATSEYSRPYVRHIRLSTADIVSGSRRDPVSPTDTDTFQMPDQLRYQHFDSQLFLYRVQTHKFGECTNLKFTMYCQPWADMDGSCEDFDRAPLFSLPGSDLGSGRRRSCVQRIYQSKMPRGAYVPRGSGFCPATGRMCYVNVLDARWNKFGPSLIEIVDFLCSPDESNDTESFLLGDPVKF